jgi:hypothetical protein
MRKKHPKHTKIIATFIILFVVALGLTLVLFSNSQKSKVLEENQQNIKQSTITTTIPDDWEVTSSEIHQISFQYPKSVEGIIAELDGLTESKEASVNINSQSIWIYYSYKNRASSDYGYIINVFENVNNLSVEDWWNSTFSQNKVFKISNRTPDNYKINSFALNNEMVLFFQNSVVAHTGYIKKVGDKIIILELNQHFVDDGPLLTENTHLSILSSIKTLY